MAQAMSKSYPVDFIYLDSPEKITAELVPAMLALGYDVTISIKRVFDAAVVPDPEAPVEDPQPPTFTDNYAFTLFKISDDDPTGLRSRVQTEMGRVVVLEKGRLYETSPGDFLEKNTPV